MIYLDHAATTSISDEALEVYQKVAKNYFGNASSMHDKGSGAEQILEKLEQGEVVNQITVPEEVAEHAVLALNRMLDRS